jgi:alkylation response protein AidB-like acyl-CoA dehydrogenase
MPEYKAPLRDMSFVMNELLDAEGFNQTLPGYEEATRDLMDAIVEEGAKFAENVLSPLNEPGDDEGCVWSEEGVKTPSGFPEAYKQYVDNGWPALSAEVAYGGQGMPNLLGIVINELAGTANWSWLMYPGLSHGAIKTIEEHGDEEQKQKYLTRLIEGSWTGTMCLTESHCGSDLGLLRTKAEPQADGSYAITGTKIFISAGEHDMADNIVHIVLARLPDAPPGTKGTTTMVVPVNTTRCIARP